MKISRWYLRMLFLLLGSLVLAASLYSLTGKPPVWFDEGIFLHTSRVLADYGLFGVQVAPDTFDDLTIVTVGYPLLAPIAAVTKLFGPSIFAARSVMVLFIVGFVACFFLLARKLYGQNLALIGTFLLASFAPLYGVGKSVIGEVPGLFYLAFGLLFFHIVETQSAILSARRRYVYAFLAGLGLGLAAATKPVFLVLIAALAVAVLARARFWRFRLYECLIGAGGFVLAMLIWVATQFGGSFAPARVLSFYTGRFALPPDVAGDVIRTNLVRFLSESTPAHFTLLFAACVLFLGIKLWKRERLHGSEIIAFVFVVLVFVSYLKTPGWYRYFFPAHAVLFLFLPAAAVRIGSSISSWLRAAILVVLVILIAVQLGHFYREEHGFSPDSTARARTYLETIPPEESVLFFNAGELAYLYPHKNFSQYFLIDGELQIGESSLPKLAAREFDILIAPTAYLDDEYVPHEFDYDCYESVHEAGNYSFLAKDVVRCSE